MVGSSSNAGTLPVPNLPPATSSPIATSLPPADEDTTDTSVSGATPDNAAAINGSDNLDTQVCGTDSLRVYPSI